MKFDKETVMERFRNFTGKEASEEAPHLTRWLGGVLQDVQEDECTVEFTVRTEMTNPLGLLHGGIQAAIIDDVIGMTLFIADPELTFVSINLSIDFLGGAREGDKVIAKSKIIRKGNQVANLVCELFDERGRVVSRGTSNMFRKNSLRS